MLIPQLGAGYGPATTNYAFPGLGGEVIEPYQPTTINPLNASMPTVGGSNSGMFGNMMGGIGGAIKGLSNSLGGPGGVLNAGIGAIGTLGNLYYAGQANKLAKQQFNYARGITDTNIANQIQSYNTRLGDIARSRAFTEGQSDAERDRYIEENRLRDRRG